VRSYFDANNGSTVNFSGRSVGDEFHAKSGSTVNISTLSCGVLLALALVSLVARKIRRRKHSRV